MMGAVPKLLLPDDDAPKQAVRGMLRREGDAAKYLHRAVGDLTSAARDVGLGDRGSLRGLFRPLVQGGRRV